MVGLQDLELVSSKILAFPFYYVLYLFIVRVFLEEWFFRGFLVKRIGVILSSLVFAAGHLAYGSIVEVVGAFVLGMVLAYYFKRTGNLWINIVAHLLYNFSAYVLILFFV